MQVINKQGQESKTKQDGKQIDKEKNKQKLN